MASSGLPAFYPGPPGPATRSGPPRLPAGRGCSTIQSGGADMSERATTVLAEVLGWPADERGELAARLLESLDAGADADAAEAWDEEIRVRLEEVRSGKVTPV